jgi:hypothetical protein
MDLSSWLRLLPVEPDPTSIGVGMSVEANMSFYCHIIFLQLCILMPEFKFFCFNIVHPVFFILVLLQVLI